MDYHDDRHLKTLPYNFIEPTQLHKKDCVEKIDTSITTDGASLSMTRSTIATSFQGTTERKGKMPVFIFNQFKLIRILSNLQFLKVKVITRIRIEYV